MTDRTPQDIAAALAAPFAPDQVDWKPQSIKGDRALAVAYIDARLVMDRLDQVLGVGNWQTTYREVKDGVLCTLSVRIHDAWVCHEDFGSFSDQPDAGDRIKAAASDGLKRCGVHLGVGRYLYRIPSVWVDYDTTRKRFTKQPQLPDWAVPRSEPGTAQPAVANGESEQKATPPSAPNSTPAKGNAMPQTGEQLEARLSVYDDRLSKEGLIMAGDLLLHVSRIVAEAGHGLDVRKWNGKAIKLGVQAAVDYESGQRAKKSRKDATLQRLTSTDWEE
jgi:hypothetical protein